MWNDIGSILPASEVISFFKHDWNNRKFPVYQNAHTQLHRKKEHWKWMLCLMGMKKPTSSREKGERG